MKGTLKLAYKLLVNDTAKFTALLMGIVFAVFLMMFVTSMFAGVLNHASATVVNIGSTLWVMDPAVQTVANTVGMPDYVLDAVRSMHGVKYAVPLYSGGGLVKLPGGAESKGVLSEMPSKISPGPPRPWIHFHTESETTKWERAITWKRYSFPGKQNRDRAHL